jgi:NUMOD4 motif/Winged helix-turn-helix DNA-binding
MRDRPEEWRPIADYEGYYDVSNYGRIKRVKGGSGAVAGRILKQSFDKDGYRQVDLSKEGVSKSCRVHQAVALAFIGRCPPGHTVNHKFGDKSNNHDIFLEYLTVGDQNRHMVAMGLNNPQRGMEHHGSKTTEEGVRFARAQKGRMKQREIAAVLGISPSTVWEIQTRRIWSHIL